MIIFLNFSLSLFCWPPFFFQPAAHSYFIFSLYFTHYDNNNIFFSTFLFQVLMCHALSKVWLYDKNKLLVYSNVIINCFFIFSSYFLFFYINFAFILLEAKEEMWENKEEVLIENFQNYICVRDNISWMISWDTTWTNLSINE